MLRLRFLNNKFQKRLIRPLYAQTQATPYAGSLDPALGTGSTLVAPTTGAFAGLTYSANTFTFQSGLVPGTVMLKSAASAVVPHHGANLATVFAFGLLANFVGGNMDELGDENTVGVWRGPDSVFELIAPAYDDTGLAAAYASATAGSPVAMWAGADGRLTANGAQGNRQTVAQLIERPSATRIVIDLKI